MRRLKLLLASIVLACTAAAQSVPRDGFDLYYQTSGKGPLLVLLSGGPGFDVDYLQPVAARLSDGFTCVLVEQRGTGRSIPPKINPETMTLHNMVDDLEALRISLKQDRLTLVGHSWGGMLAMAYAAAYPLNVDRMLLLSSGGMDMSYQTYFGPNIHVRLQPSDLKTEKAATGPFEKIRAILPGYFYDRTKALAFAAEMQPESFHAKASAAMFADLWLHYHVREALRQVDQPVLLVQGRQDPVGESTAYETHLTLKNSSLKFINECGHFPWLEQPTEFFRAVREFLSATPQ